MVEDQASLALRDWLATAGLFAVTTAVVLWQNARIAVLWDTSYIPCSTRRSRS
jgi:hypothetical protein